MRTRNWVVLCLVIILTACGGGGGETGGGNTGTSGSNYGVGFDLNVNSASFSAANNGPVPATQDINISVTASNAAYIVAGYPPGTTQPSWLDLGLTGSGNNWTLSIRILTTSLTAGTHTATVRVVITDSNNNVIGYRDIPVSYTLTNGLAVSTQQLVFTHVNGGSSIPSDQTINIYGNGISWSASADQSWVTLSNTSGTAPSSLNVGVNPTGMAVGDYNATITITDGTDSISINIGLTISAPVLNVSTQNLNFTHVHGVSSPPPNQTINITGNNIPWSASTNQTWVTLSNTSGTSPSSLDIGVNPTGMAAGSHNATVTITDGTKSISINIGLTISAPVLNVSTQNVNFAHMNGVSSTPPNQTVNITGDNVPWSVNADQAWVILSSTSGTGPSSFDVGVNPTSMTSGSYNATVTITYGNSSISINIDLTISAPSISVTPGSILLGGADGMSFDAQQLQFSLSTGSNAHPWTTTFNSSSGPAWLLSDSTSGTVSATAATINLDSDRSGLSSGTHTGTLTLSANVNGEIISTDVPVTLNIESHRLFVADNGVALASMPTLSNLSHTVLVQDTYGLTTTDWSASSNQAWLTVTPNGYTGDNLIITADPTNLSDDTLHLATVTITSSDASIENSETINVGFWVGASDPTDNTISAVYTEVVADPVKPYVYIHSGGTDISIYNIHTDSLETSISGVAQQLGPMAVSSDGSMLYASDLNSGQIVPVDLQTNTPSTPWDLDSLPGNMRLACARPKGYNVVLASDGYAYEAATGTRLPDTFTANGNIAANMDGDLFFVQNLGVSPASLYRYDMDYSVLAGQGLTIVSAGRIDDGSNGRDLAVSEDGLRLYTACGAPYTFSYYDTVTLNQIGTLPAAAYPNNIHVGVNGLIYGARTGSGAPPDVWVYNGTNLLASYNISGTILDRQLTVSGDGLRIIVLTDNDTLQFITGP